MSVLTQDYSQGGFSMINTEKQILRFRLRRLGRLLEGQTLWIALTNNKQYMQFAFFIVRNS